MAIKRNLILAGSVATIAISTLGVGMASAANNPNRDDLVSKIASKFNLNENDVQSVFDENRAEHEQEHRAKQEERLQKAVDNGKITEEQKTKILAKMDENKTFFESLKDMTKSERKAAMDQHKSEMEAWAKENGIDRKMMHPPRGEHHGPRNGHFDHDEMSEN